MGRLRPEELRVRAESALASVVALLTATIPPAQPAAWPPAADAGRPVPLESLSEPRPTSSPPVVAEPGQWEPRDPWLPPATDE